MERRGHASLCALVPKPRKHLVTYHGVAAYALLVHGDDNATSPVNKLSVARRAVAR